MPPLLTARVRFRKDGQLYEGWHCVECKHTRIDFGIGVELLTSHVIEALHKLDVPIDALVSIDIAWAPPGGFAHSMVKMLLPDLKDKKIVRRYYTIKEM